MMTMNHVVTDHGAVAYEIQAGRWRLDPTRSTLSFRIPPAWGLRRTKGELKRFAATVDIHGDDVMHLSAERRSVVMTHISRHDRLLGKSLFDGERYPIIEFKSRDIAVTKEYVTIDGRLTAAGGAVEVRATGTLGLRSVEHELDIELFAEIDQAVLGVDLSLYDELRGPMLATLRGTLVNDHRGSLLGTHAARPGAAPA